MTRRFSVGLAFSLVVAVVTIAAKSALTKYPGLGDFLLFSLVADILPSRLNDGIYAVNLDLRVISYIAKATLAAVLYTVLFLSTKKKPLLQMPVSVGVCALVLLSMSLGEAVVA